MLFIFDWDGTLSDSTAKITQALQAALNDVGVGPCTDAQVRHIIGLGLPEAVRTLVPDIGERDLNAVRSRYVYHYEEVDQTPPPLYPTALFTLEALLAQGHRLAIATGKTRRGLDKMLAQLGLTELFHGSRCADETRSKPHPLMLHELLREFAVSPDQAVMVGDTTFDLEMAQRACVPSVAATYGAHPEGLLLPFAPVQCITEVCELLDIRF